MRIAILDPAAGISGDMLLGALVDAGGDDGWLRALPQALGFDDVTCSIETVERAALTAVKVTWTIRGQVEGPGGAVHGANGSAHQAHGMHVADLLAHVRRAPLSAEAQARAARAFQLIGEAEGKVHGISVDRVHLHEVGAIDAVLDVVGTVGMFERLGVEAVYHHPVGVGSGWVTAAHGQLPVPAPATALLLEGMEIASGGPVTGEATTPTGAALLRVVSEGSPPVRWRAGQIGWGAGTRNPAEWPNALRLTLGEASAEAGVICLVATDVDDLTPEYLEPVRQAVFRAGAVDCVTWPTQGKKGRVSFRIEALVPPDRERAVTEALLAHSSTTGVRQITTSRVTLTRREGTVELAGGARVRVKVWDGPAGPRWKAEFDDVIAAAEREGRPAWEVARDAEWRARDVLGPLLDEDASTER